ncbi:zeaxanthin epoxidase, chloroplastic [Haematococcus lacustris]|uniref:Zeaxanthin epoxidase, chloroplastic n=1 Tax=Haematococcus lacustris TaxID=44745 RepID=A0A699ZQT1_HAELA|nr:zeaxanthin epoxidase, chloroplastic [Haematococcus lacustris]
MLPGEKEDMPQLVGGGMGVPGCKARVLQLLADAGFKDVVQVVQATPEADIFERAMLDRIPLDELGAGLSGAGGRLLLLGDAAHAMHSGPGQGARMAFEDAHQLVEALERHKDRLLGWQHLPSGAIVPQLQPTPPVEDVEERLQGQGLGPTASNALNRLNSEIQS